MDDGEAEAEVFLPDTLQQVAAAVPSKLCPWVEAHSREL